MSKYNDPFDPEFEFLFKEGERDPEKRLRRIRQFVKRVKREIEKEEEPTLRDRLVYDGARKFDPDGSEINSDMHEFIVWDERAILPKDEDYDR